MLDECPETRESITVLRLASILGSKETFLTILLNRGISLEDAFETVSAVSGKTSFSLEEVIGNVFQAREGKTPPFGKGRFGDGTIGVYYSAIEEDTCKEEVAFHLQKQVRDLNDDPNPRTFHLIECSYDGATRDLRGKELEYTDLTSETETGYPFCQNLAQTAIECGIDGFFAPSARNSGGTCVPIFRRKSLSDPRAERSYSATVQLGRVQFQ